MTVCGAMIAAGAILIPLTAGSTTAAPSTAEPWTGLEGEAFLPKLPGVTPRVVGTPTGTKVRSPGWVGAIRLSAGWAYSSGYAHRAWDVAMPLGTKLYAPRKGVVIGYNDGVRNNPYGYNPGSGSPSNWVLLCHTINGVQVSSYWQHMSPGITLKIGQVVSGPRFDPATGLQIPGSGTLLGESGNTGNSTGPHLHLASFVGCAKPTKPGANTPAGWSRYHYLSYPNRLIWEPNRLWSRPMVDATALLSAFRSKARSPFVATLRRIAGQKSASTLPDPSFRQLIRQKHRQLGMVPFGRPSRPFLLKWATTSEEFTVKF